MESLREQRCRACLLVFWICCRCDRGQAYCGEECQEVGRRRSVQKAKRKYLSDPDVREGERQRLREYRARVRDQGSRKVAPTASVLAAATVLPTDGSQRGAGERHAENEVPLGGLRPVDGGVPCALCGHRARFVRFGPLRSYRRPRWTIRARAP